MARFVEKQVRLIYCILRERIENRGFTRQSDGGILIAK
jgi:hypothetical protein